MIYNWDMALELFVINGDLSAIVDLIGKQIDNQKKEV